MKYRVTITSLFLTAAFVVSCLVSALIPVARDIAGIVAIVLTIPTLLCIGYLLALTSEGSDES
jgi:hypothetical protein